MIQFVGIDESWGVDERAQVIRLSNTFKFFSSHARQVLIPPHNINRTKVSQANNLLNVLDQLCLLDGSRAILVKFDEALVEIPVADMVAFQQVRESVPDESPGLFLVKLTRVIGNVLCPDLVDALANNLVNFIKIIRLKAFDVIGIAILHVRSGFFFYL